MTSASVKISYFFLLTLILNALGRNLLLGVYSLQQMLTRYYWSCSVTCLPARAYMGRYT